jgi:hypothetical protein
VVALLNVVGIVSEDVVEGKPGGIDPSSSLVHEFYWVSYCISPGNCVGDVLHSIPALLLTEDTKTKNTIFCQVHVCLPVITFSEHGVQNLFEVPFLKQVLPEC